jgi:NADPH:quinone reductase-like Zn-dependent oxidoreductase
MEAGARAVVNHRQPGWGKKVPELNRQERVDRVIDVEFGANLPEVLNAIRTGGTIATYSSTQVPEPQLPFLKMMYMDLTMRLVIVYAMPEEAKRQAIADIDQSLRQNRLQHRIAHALPLAEIARAQQIIEHGDCRGCVVVKTGNA